MKCERKEKGITPLAVLSYHPLGGGVVHCLCHCYVLLLPMQQGAGAAQGSAATGVGMSVYRGPVSPCERRAGESTPSSPGVVIALAARRLFEVRDVATQPTPVAATTMACGHEQSRRGAAVLQRRRWRAPLASSSMRSRPLVDRGKIPDGGGTKQRGPLRMTG